MHRVARTPIPLAVPALLCALAVGFAWVDRGWFGWICIVAATWWAVCAYPYRIFTSILVAKHGISFQSADDASTWHSEAFLPALEEALEQHWLMGPLLVRTDEEAVSLKGRLLGLVSFTNWGMAIWPLWASAIDSAVRTTVLRKR